MDIMAHSLVCYFGDTLLSVTFCYTLSLYLKGGMLA